MKSKSLNFAISFIFIFLIFSSLIVIDAIPDVNRDRSLDRIIGKAKNIVNTTDTGFNYNLSLVPTRLPVRQIERPNDFVIGNNKVIIKTSKNNTIDFENAVFNARYLSIQNAVITEPVEVIMWTGDDGVIYGIKRHENASKSFNEIALEGEQLFNVKSQNGYVSFELDGFSAIISGLPDISVRDAGQGGNNADAYELNVEDYCSPSCHRDSTYIQFVDPQTSNTVQVFHGESYNGFYFDVDNFDNLITFDGDNSHSGISVTIFVCENAFCSQDADTMIIRISDELPEQISSIADIDLGTDGSDTLFMNNIWYFSSYEGITIQWEDDVLLQTVSISRDKDQTGSICADGEIFICLRGTGSNVRMDMESKNLDSLIDVAMEADIRNPGASLTADMDIIQGTFRIVSEAEAPPPPVNPPVQIASIQPISLSWNGGDSRDMNSFYVNQTNNMTVITFLNLTSAANATIGAGETYLQDELRIALSSSGQTVQIDSFTTNVPDYRIWISVCNVGGCIGNSSESSILLNVLQVIPEQIASILPITLGFSDSDSRITSSYFINYVNSNITFTNPVNTTINYTLIPGESQSVPGYMDVDYSALDVITVTSYLQNLTSLIYINVSGGGTTVSDTLLVTISADAGEEEAGEGAAGAVSTFTNLFNSLFPDSDTLSLSQRAAYVVVIVLAVTGGLFVIAHSNTGGIPPAMLYIVGAIDIVLFFFFVTIGYIPIVVPIFMFLIAGALVWFRTRSGG